MVGRVAGRVHGRDPQGPLLQDLPVAEMFGALQAERVQRRTHLSANGRAPGA